MSTTGPKIVITIGVETARKHAWKDTDPLTGEYQTSVLLARRLTRSMANSLAAQIKQRLIRAGFKPLKGYRELR